MGQPRSTQRMGAASPLEAVEKPKPVPHHFEPGCQPDVVYAAALSPGRDSLRRWLVARLPGESEYIAKFQQHYRTPARDKFFFWTAIFGTHTFFMVFLPLLFFLGYPQKARGLLYVVGLGIYWSCVAKDLACAPRPYSPPVTRLSMSTHHREYGFPSSHSTNSISIALHMGTWLWELRGNVGWVVVTSGWIVLFFYYASVAGGRLYTGMHSTMDVVGGSLLGIGCWLAWQLLGEYSEAWVNSGSLTVPIVMIPTTLVLVHYHPETPDDCPCFEDAIAILAVILGSFLGHLYSVRSPRDLGPSVWADGLLWGLATALCRFVMGVAVIVVWRLVAKSTLLRVLPPLFRAASKITDLPTRRFYTPATAYKGGADGSMRPIPSFVELPHADSSDSLAPPDRNQSRRRSPSPLIPSDGAVQMRARQGHGNGHGQKAEGIRFDPVAGNSHRGRKASRRPHYDAEVLTKLGVYSGIGLIATTLLPIAFRQIEVALGLP